MAKTTTHQRLLICWFSQPHLQDAVHSLLDDHSFDYVGLIAKNNYLGEKADVFLRSNKTRKHCHFPDHQTKHVPSREIIEKMRGTEAEVLKMMDRMFKSPFKPRQYEFRKRLYYSQLCMAYGFLMEHGFTRVIFSNIPHNSFDFILFGLCKAIGIKSSFLYQIQIKDRFLHAYTLDELYDQLELPKDYDIADNHPLAPCLEEEIEERVQTKSPFYMSNKRVSSQIKWKARCKSLFRIYTYTQPLYAIPSALAYKSIPKYIPTSESKFVYFALHMQPEATTSPMGGVFVDQYYVILMIARSLPEGVKVLVKEHPRQKFWQRSKDFYHILQAEPNVEFVSLKQNSFELIKQSLAVATITGTVGWEALFLGKPVLLFGHIFYKHIPGVINVNDTESLAKALEQILKGEFTLPSIKDIRKHLCYIDSCCYRGAVNNDYFEVSHLSPEKNAESVKKALVDHLVC